METKILVKEESCRVDAVGINNVRIYNNSGGDVVVSVERQQNLLLVRIDGRLTKI